MIHTRIIKTAAKGPVRRTFANQLHALGEYMGREFHGSARRVSTSQVDIMIATDMPKTNTELGDLWAFLMRRWKIPKEDISVESNAIDTLDLFSRKFMVVANGEGSNVAHDTLYSNEEDIQGGGDAYTVVSSVHPR